MTTGTARLWDQHFNLLATEPCDEPDTRGDMLTITVHGNGALHAATQTQIRQELKHLTYDPDPHTRQRTRIGGTVTKIEVDTRPSEHGSQTVTTIHTHRYTHPEEQPKPETLNQLEHRVVQRYAAAASARLPAYPPPLDPSDWLTEPLTERLTHPQVYPNNLSQFPREQWITQPHRRMVTLHLVDQALNSADKLTEGDWLALGFLIAYGGRERIA